MSRPVCDLHLVTAFGCFISYYVEDKKIIFQDVHILITDTEVFPIMVIVTVMIIMKTSLLQFV